MATVNSREVVDAIIEGDGYYPGDSTKVVKIVQYNNMFNGGIAYGLVYEIDPDYSVYENSENCHDPVVIFDVTEPPVHLPASDTILLKTVCLVCDGEEFHNLDKAGYDRWQAGEHIQSVWPEFSADKREMLISGTHPKCWDELWA
jgi:hypothetical protein